MTPFKTDVIWWGYRAPKWSKRKRFTHAWLGQHPVSLCRKRVRRTDMVKISAAQADGRYHPSACSSCLESFSAFRASDGVVSNG